MKPGRKTALIVLVGIAVYFPIYLLCGPIFGAIYAGFFLVADIFSWRAAFKLFDRDDDDDFSFIPLFGSAFAIVIFFANLHEVFSTVSHDGKPVAGLWEHLYFSIVTFTTLGYGDYLPVGVGKAFAAVEALLGYGYFAIIIGVFSSIFYSKIR